MNKSFNELNINNSIVVRLEKQNITIPTGIQETAIPFALENKDIIAEAHTGTGKTLAFLIPIFEKINVEKREMQAIILAPTHELVVQIESQIKLLSTNSGINVTSLSTMGESNIEKQIKKLKEIKPHIIVGSPGRILDLIKKKKITAHTIKTIVLDEADNLLSKNKPVIIKDIIKSTMKDRQLMFFSASINKETLNLAKTLVKDVEIIKIENKSEINPKIEHICILGSLRDRFENLRKLLAAEQPQRAIVFVNNNTDLRQINEKLQYHKVKSTAIYGNASKEERQRALDAFRRGKCNVLVSSDLSARGLDIPEVSHIISLDFPVNPDEYLHRAGRTARGNNSGVSVCLITNKDIEILQSYEKAFDIEFTVKIIWWKHYGHGTIIIMIINYDYEIKDETRRVSEKYIFSNLP